MVAVGSAARMASRPTGIMTASEPKGRLVASGEPKKLARQSKSDKSPHGKARQSKDKKAAEEWELVQRDAMLALGTAKQARFAWSAVGFFLYGGWIMLAVVLTWRALPWDHATCWALVFLNKTMLSVPSVTLVHWPLSIYWVHYVYSTRGWGAEHPYLRGLLAACVATALHCAWYLAAGIFKLYLVQICGKRFQRNWREKADELAREALVNFSEHELQLLEDRGVYPWAPNARDVIVEATHKPPRGSNEARMPGVARDEAAF